MTTILIALQKTDIQEKQVSRIRSIMPEAKLVFTEKEEEIEPLLDEIDIAAGHFPLGCLARASRLQWFQQWGAGTDWLMHHPEIAERDFILTNASGVHAIPISEHILSFLLAFARQLPSALRAQANHEWERFGSPPIFELAGKNMLLIGVGAIGKRTAHIARALGMHITGVRRDPSKTIADIEKMIGPEALEEALPDADFVVLTMPLTKETHGMFNRRFFEKMKTTSYLINIGRGGTVDEAALVEALQSDQIAGAGLDVFAVEPLPANSPLWDLPNVMITGHYSGETPYYDERAMEIFIDNLERFAAGSPMRNIVDKKRGY